MCNYLFIVLESDIYDLLVAMGPTGCRKLEKLDLRPSSSLSNNMAPLLKFCDNIKFFGFVKNHMGSDLYFNMIYNTDIAHLAVQVTDETFFQDSDLVDITLILPNIEKLEIPGTMISDISLSEIADETNALRMLNVSGCIGITDIGLTDILNKCPMLTHLDVQNTPTMQRCVRSILDHLELSYLNAMETNLNEEDAQLIHERFESMYRPYEFIYSRAFVGADNRYNLVTVTERSRPDWDHYAESDIESQFDTISIDDKIWSDPKLQENAMDKHVVEITATEYLERLQRVVDEPVSNSHVVYNWAEEVFESDSDHNQSIFDQLRAKLYNEDPENSERVRETARSKQRDGEDVERTQRLEEDEDERAWRQIDYVAENLEFLRREYKTLLKHFEENF